MQDQIRALRAASRELVRELSLIQRDAGEERLSKVQRQALIEIGSSGVGPAELSERLLMDKTAASRLIRQLTTRGWIRASAAADDRRRRRLELTRAGEKVLSGINAEADRRIGDAMQGLSEERLDQVREGIATFARALRRGRLREEFSLRPIRKTDNEAVASIIRSVMPEYGAEGEGYAINDPEVDQMYEAYKQPRNAYFVLTRGERVVGGGGIAPLEGADEDVCELRKMYFLPEARGLGFGQDLLNRALAVARQKGFRRCYLETLAGMDQAQGLYRRNGFEQIDQPMGNTGHFGCDTWFVREL